MTGALPWSCLTVTFCCFVVSSLPLACAFGAQSLDRVHHIGLLRQHGVAELLGPVELVIHHRQHGRRRYELLDARVPVLLVESPLQLVAFQHLVGFGPALGLDHLERIGRRHQHLRQQRVRIERDRRDELIELTFIEQLLRTVRCSRTDLEPRRLQWKEALRPRTRRWLEVSSNASQNVGRATTVRLLPSSWSL